MTLFDYLNRYPSSPGYKDTDTSRKAADSMKGQTSRLRRMVLSELRNGPGTADEIASRIGETILSVRPRLTELLHMQAIRDTGRRGVNASGRSAKVFEVTA